MAIRVTGMASGMDTDAMVKDLVSAYRKKGESFTKQQTKLEWKQDAWKDINSKVKSFFTKYASEMRFSTAYAKKSTVSSDSSKASVVASENAVNGTQNLKITQLAKSGYLTGGKLTMTDSKGKNVAVTANTKLSELGYTGGSQTMKVAFGKADATGEYADQTEEFEIDGDTTIAQLTSLISSSSSKVSASFDEANGRIFVNSSSSGEDNNFHLIAGDGSDISELLSKVKLSGSEAVRIDGENAKIELNGVEFESDTNTFSINGLAITAKDLTTGSGITLTTDTDYDGIYSKIKDFFKEYNSLVNEITKLYNADSASKFEPLTSEEKEEMTDDEVEKWEKKIKDSLLRRDSDLNAISMALTDPMLSVYEINGTKYSLSSFGIETLGYFNAPENERNAFHILGDEDDGEVSGQANKLKSMLASNPKETSEFFQQLINGLYTTMNKIQMNSTENTSYGSFYSDKLLKADITAQEKKVKDWESKVADIEEKYYKQFGAMEKAMTKMNSQQSALASLFGGGQ